MESLLFLNIGGPEIIIIVFAGLLPLILMVYCIMDILKSTFKDNNTKLLWAIIVLLAPVIGPVMYILMSKKQKA